MTANSSTSLQRAAIIVNPAKPVDIDVRGLVAKHCVENGWGEPMWFETTKEDPGVGQAKEALAQGADIVIAAGGDGTVRLRKDDIAQLLERSVFGRFRADRDRGRRPRQDD